MADVGLHAVADSAAKFADQFFKVIANDNPGNLITSPLSAQVLLAMAAYGANGTTASQMRSALLMHDDDEIGLSGYKSVIEVWNDPKRVEFRIANKMYTTNQSPINPAYKEFTAKKFLSVSQEMNFDDAQGTVKVINFWSEKKTNRHIKDVITPDSLGPDTSMILLSAVYLKGKWDKIFDPSLTKLRPFHLRNSVTTNVPTMCVSRSFRVGDLPELSATFIEIPYQGREINMIIIKPNEIDGLPTVVDNIHKSNLNCNLLAYGYKDTEVYLPKFKIEQTFDLQGPLEKLGMTEMFQQQASFSGVAAGQLKVSKVVQKAHIEVNEEGTYYGRSFPIWTMPPYVPPPRFVFRVDRPFYFVIYHNSTRMPLFSGVVCQPSMG